LALGSDIAGVSSIDWALSTVEGRVALAQAILRRLITPEGSLLGGPASYGFDLLDLIGSDMPESIIAGRIQEQVLAEEEVLDCGVTASFNAGASSLDVRISVVDGDGPFVLTVSASDLTIEAFLDDQLIVQEAA